MADKLPPPPPDVGQVLSAIYSPCAIAPWMLIGLAAFDGLTAWWSIVSPNWKDSYKAGGRGSWIHGLKEIMIDAEEKPPTWWIVLQDEAVVFFELVDMFLFWFMVGMATVTGLLDWTSQIWELSGCKPKANEKYIYSKTPNGILINSNMGWQPDSSWVRCKSNAGYTQIGTFITIPANSTYTFYQMCHWTNLGGEQFRPVNFRVTDMDTGEVLFHHDFNFEQHDLQLSNGAFLKNQFTHDRARTIMWECQMAVSYPDIITWAADGHLAIQWATWE